jgi:MFS family permease
VGDRFGRRASASGFFLTAALILFFLFVPFGVAGQSVVAFLYGSALGCSVVWGPWLAELYPQHLRSTAASIFNWGRVVSFVAPLITGFVAERFGLAYTMTLASVVFCVAAIIWLRLPETLHRDREPDPEITPLVEVSVGLSARHG